MRRFSFFLLIFILPHLASAHVPELPDFASADSTTAISNPQISQAFYTELTGFPHRYTLSFSESSELFVEVLVPDIPEATNDVGAVITRLGDGGEPVVVTTLSAPDAAWESFYEPFGGDSYRQGPGFEDVVPAGEYQIVVSNLANTGKYVLVVGKLEDFSEVGMLETIKRIYGVKQFYGKSPLAVLQSPFYAIPVGIIVLILVVVWYRKKKYHA